VKWRALPPYLAALGGLLWWVLFSTKRRPAERFRHGAGVRVGKVK
jgi:hypothetical protein